MARYLERQLYHQRQLLSLELPDMLQNRSQSLNDRFRKMLGIGDQHQQSDPDLDLADWRADSLSEDRQWDDEDEDDDHPLHGSSAGDLLFEEIPLQNLANAHIEVVDALPSPACDTANFAVISYTCLSLCLSVSTSSLCQSRALTQFRDPHKLHTNALDTRPL